MNLFPRCSVVYLFNALFTLKYSLFFLVLVFFPWQKIKKPFLSKFSRPTLSFFHFFFFFFNNLFTSIFFLIIINSSSLYFFFFFFNFSFLILLNSYLKFFFLLFPIQFFSLFFFIAFPFIRLLLLKVCYIIVCMKVFILVLCLFFKLLFFLLLNLYCSVFFLDYLDCLYYSTSISMYPLIFSQYVVIFLFILPSSLPQQIKLDFAKSYTNYLDNNPFAIC
jgi:hypothetical protein